MIRRATWAFVIFTLAVPFLLISLLSDMFVRHKRKKSICFLKTPSFFSSIVLKVMGINVRVRNHELLPKANENYLIISNHLSYIDILIISSVIPSIFIASIDEVRDRFLVGTIAKFGGSVFVERRSRANLLQEVEVISGLLKEGFNVVLFSEGGTSNGERVLSFKSSFIDPAIESNVNILSICLKYVQINGKNIDAGNRDLVFYYGDTTFFYYGDTTFFKHFLDILSVKSVDVELIGLESIKVNQNLSRKKLAELAFNSISLAYL